MNFYRRFCFVFHELTALRRGYGDQTYRLFKLVLREENTSAVGFWKLFELKCLGGRERKFPWIKLGPPGTKKSDELRL